MYELSGDITLPASPEEIWELLNDASALARALPGCERLVRESEDLYRADLRVGLAGIKGTYRGTLRVADRKRPEWMCLEIGGNGAGGFVQVSGTIRLQPSDGGTALHYEWQIQVGGPVAMVGQRVLGGAARHLVGDFFARLEREARARAGQGGGTSGTGAVG
ncbi:SRPBCC family protein [Caldinitratiruptor microaerophilus]|uniref:Carbon monoxide dehydrogenase subunit G n=1 Tax=Caldinitratiruptor microaerophilus TaxID=671077 RepID=A0AA35CLW2_9FIRM|nr:carbon monoxide dehydrogenase subunit G [Caldinitratiruptor microaerophilus]BDG60793.1 hypothetical protein caldi_18830 [Caldinitratiruptor microaerophilus]